MFNWLESIKRNFGAEIQKYENIEWFSSRRLNRQLAEICFIMKKKEKQSKIDLTTTILVDRGYYTG